MVRNQWKRFLCLVLAIVIIVSLSVTGFAADSGQSYVQDCITGIIKAVFSHERFIAREIVRAQFRTAATIGAALGLRTAAALLNHSLQNDPEDFIWDSNSRFAKQIENSAEYKAFDGNFANSGNITFDIKNNPDLYLAYHGMTYVTSDDGITFKDTYDFHDNVEWGEPFSLQSIIAAVNSFAIFAQKIGAIQNYDISVTVETPS